MEDVQVFNGFEEVDKLNRERHITNIKKTEIKLDFMMNNNH